MIIKINQTSSNIKQEYEIECPDFRFSAEAGYVSRMQKIQMSNSITAFTGDFNLSKWENYIPFRYLFGSANLTRVFAIKQNEKDIGTFVFSRHGFLKSFYVISISDDTILHCYARAKGSYNYISAYKSDNQIALIETYLCCNDYKYKHKIYLLDDYNQCAEIISLFTVYYASYNFTHRMHMSSGSHYKKGYSYSRYNNKYDPSWREKYFPNENFFGKTSLFDN